MEYMLIQYAPLSGASDVVLLLIRVVMGVIFLYFGWPKLKDLKSNATDFENMGFRSGWLFGTLVALLEVVGGVGLILGVLTWLWAAGFAIHMGMGTIWKISKKDKPFTDWSYDVLLLVLALTLLTFGAGKFAIDTLI